MCLHDCLRFCSVIIKQKVSVNSQEMPFLYVAEEFSKVLSVFLFLLFSNFLQTAWNEQAQVTHSKSRVFVALNLFRVLGTSNVKYDL